MDISKVKQFLIKQEKDGNQKEPFRLPSLKAPRDLSLRRRPAKVYTPNFQAARTSTSKESPRPAVQHTPSFKAKDRQRSKGRDFKHREALKSQYIQSESIFAFGVGDNKLLRSERFSSSRSSDYKDILPSLDRPEIKQDCWKIDIKDEDSILENTILVEDEELELFNSLKPKPAEIKEEMKQELKDEIKTESGIKKETHESESLENKLELKLNLNVGFLLGSAFLHDQNYSYENPHLSVIKLPNTFAGKGFSDDPEEKKTLDYPLKEMLDGKIGKLCIRKSGKMEVHIGNIVYNLRESEYDPTTSVCHEEAIYYNNKNGKIEMNVLEQIKDHYLLTPKWDSLI